MNRFASIHEWPYFRDVLDQPRALAATWQALEGLAAPDDLARRLRNGAFKRIVLTGMGSSFHALHPLNFELVASGFMPTHMETSELIHYGADLLGPSTLLVAVSQSGRSAETLRLLELNAGRACVVGVTNTADSPLAEQATLALLTQAGEEHSVSCKTYVSSLMALRWLAAGLCGFAPEMALYELSSAAPAVEAYLSDWRDHVQTWMEVLEGIRHLFIVGRGPSLAAAGTGPLIIKEADHFHAEGMSSAAFRHGPMEMLNPETFVMVFGGDPRTRALNERLRWEILTHGGRTVLCSPGVSHPFASLPESPECVRPILEILPVQMITLALAVLAGREAGRFEHATKVTATE